MSFVSDNVIVLSSSPYEHLKFLDTTMGLLRTCGVTLNLSKCMLFRTMLDYLGHTILPGKLAAALELTK